MVVRGLIQRLFSSRNRMMCLIGTISEADDRVRPCSRRLVRREGGGGVEKLPNLEFLRLRIG